MFTLNTLNEYLDRAIPGTSISEEEVLFLRETFDLKDSERYTRWAELCQDLQDLKEPQKIKGAIEKRIPPGVPFAPLFLMIGRAIVAEQNQREIKGTIERWKDGADETRKSACRLKKAVSVLRRAIEESWIWDRHRKTLDEIEREITAEEHARLEIGKSFRKDFKRHIPKSGRPGDYTPDVVKAFNGVTAFLKKHGIKKEARETASLLFWEAGIKSEKVPTPEAAREHTYRKRRAKT